MGVDPSLRANLELEVRRLCGVPDYDAAVTVTLRGYGPEVLGFLMGVHAQEIDANDAFAELAEIVWRKLPSFDWQSSLRTWVYGIARNVSRTLRRNAGRRRGREGLVSGSALEAVAERVRTETLTFLRTHKRSRLEALRDSLPEEDRALIILRIDRKLEWNDIARVLAETEGDAPLDDATLRRESARLRKRYQTVKDQLRETAKREGLTAGD
jgi:RNA polymerase sigma-70 factor (ECF subfamily)